MLKNCVYLSLWTIVNKCYNVTNWYLAFILNIYITDADVDKNSVQYDKYRWEILYSCTPDKNIWDFSVG